MDIKISIIMPVYNVEKYIRKAIESILNQTLNEFELIIINDGSTDYTGEICKEYLRKDKRIKFIEIKNSGQAFARNKGLEIARGEYIGFVDGDDFIEKTMYEDLYKSCISDNSDISIIGLREVNENGEYISKYIPENIDLIEIMKRAYPWNKLIRKNIFLDNNLRFASGRYYEDVELIPKLFIKARHVSIINKIGYNYLKRNGSTTQSRDNKILDNLWAYTSIKEYMAREGVYNLYIDDFYECVNNFKKYYCRTLYDYPSKFLLNNSIKIIMNFNKIGPLKLSEYFIFIKMHLIFKIKRSSYYFKWMFKKLNREVKR